MIDQLFARMPRLRRYRRGRAMPRFSLADRLARCTTPAQTYGLLAEGRDYKNASDGTRRTWERIAKAVQEGR